MNDLKEKWHIFIEYCPTDNILGDYIMSKPLHSRKTKRNLESGSHQCGATHDARIFPSKSLNTTISTTLTTIEDESGNNPRLEGRDCRSG
jgi:hypothetical protein